MQSLGLYSGIHQRETIQIRRGIVLDVKDSAEVTKDVVVMVVMKDVM